ncbi:hypothetical protein FOZ62_024204 [Perkinsus olseni]|uniref:Uncharacterized protein n=2 Tax=Perkinsus olseni TaxID=32597 RepID=A0A7J6NDE5_PEROL|nr:hypothetical protein FOZ62_024204 [Perkinsus olseni]
MPSEIQPFTAPDDEPEDQAVHHSINEGDIATPASFSPVASPSGPPITSRRLSEIAGSLSSAESLDLVPLPSGVPEPIEICIQRSSSKLSGGSGSLLAVPRKASDPSRSSAASTLATPDQESQPIPDPTSNDDARSIQRPRSSSIADRIEAVMRESHSRFYDGTKSPEKWLLAVLLAPLFAVIPFWIPGLPDADETSTTAMVWHFVTLFVMDFAGSTMYPFVPGALLTVPLFRTPWGQFLMVPYLSAGIVTLGGIIPYLIFDVFPVPMLAVIQAAAIIPLVFVYLYFFMNPDVLQERSHRADFFVSVGILVGVTVVYGVIYPLGGALFNQLEGIPQAFMALAFCVVRGIYEKVGTRLLSKRAQDGYPLFIFSSCFCHETFIAILMNRVSAWYVFAVFIVYDLSENLYHVLELRRLQYKTECSETARQLVTVSLLMEFAEMIAPLQYTICSFAIYYFNKRPNDNFALVEDKAFWQGIFFNCLDVVGEVCVFMFLTRVIKKVTGLRSVKALGRLCVIYGVAFLAFQITILGFFLQIQYAPGGNDLTFRFNWLKDGAQWVGGLCWTTPEDPTACDL